MDDDGPTEELPREHPLSASVLVLNRNYTAIRVVNARRAFILLCKQLAEAVDARDEEFRVYDFSSWLDYSELRHIEAGVEDLFVRTPRIAILVPRVIRLVAYDKIPKREVKFSRKNILARDGNKCQYCGKRLAVAQLSLDHVYPKSRGGKSTWTNVVAACNPCNTRKGGRLPAEASMKLRTIPAAPKRNPLLQEKVNSREYQVWKLFLSEGDLALDA